MTTKKKGKIAEQAAETRWNQVESLGRGVKDAGRHVWLAGLGAVETVDERSRGLFSDLVERGQRYETKELGSFEDRFRKVGERLEELYHRVEHDFEALVARTLKRFGVPDRDEVKQLITQVEQLTKKVEALSPK